MSVIKWCVPTDNHVVGFTCTTCMYPPHPGLIQLINVKAVQELILWLDHAVNKVYRLSAITSRKFQEYLKTEGVRHELTIPKNPEQNGVAERINRTLIETARSMLIDSHLPHSFWAEAISTAAYLRNRSPTKAVAKMTPYEAWTGKKPQVDGL